ncbi:acyl-CoA thioesterase [Acuticoccus mangrovi]|uniref:Acyl-CoA thioesterase n=1 Tax=Acuticoccus mangrovi TaxID=2796142 RepID=A0A934IND0_9HYPH|nr:thioesterase family protein [Acuticoccus mangrovi]MBJ3777047.1 acyl-CoA thioesterase [Acuticoccus mangrovi]
MARPEPSARSAYALFRTVPLRWMDNDIYGHMNNVVHYSVFDTAVNGWLIEEGLLDLRASPTVGLVVSTGCDYFAEMAFPDVVAAGLRVDQLGRSSVRFGVGLFRNDDPRAAAEGQFVHVYVDRETRRPVEIDAARRAAFERLRIDRDA